MLSFILAAAFTSAPAMNPDDFRCNGVLDGKLGPTIRIKRRGETIVSHNEKGEPTVWQMDKSTEPGQLGFYSLDNKSGTVSLMYYQVDLRASVFKFVVYFYDWKSGTEHSTKGEGVCR